MPYTAPRINPNIVYWRKLCIRAGLLRTRGYLYLWAMRSGPIWAWATTRSVRGTGTTSPGAQSNVFTFLGSKRTHLVPCSFIKTPQAVGRFWPGLVSACRPPAVHLVILCRLSNTHWRVTVDPHSFTEVAQSRKLDAARSPSGA